MMATQSLVFPSLMPAILRRYCKLACFALVAISLTSSAPAALTSVSPDCNNNGAATTMGAVGCSGAWGGNNVNQNADVLSQLNADFGLGPWTYVHTANTGQDTAFLDSVPESNDDTLVFDNPVKGLFAVALKASNQFSLYLFDGGATGITTIDFVTDGVSLNGQGKAQNLSHVSLYAPSGIDPFSDTVPEPTAALLAVASLAALGIRRR